MKKYILLVLYVCAVAVLGLTRGEPRVLGRTAVLRNSPDDPPKGAGVYKIKSFADVDSTKEKGACVGFNEGRREGVYLDHCYQGQIVYVTLIPAGRGTYFIRNGDVTGPPSGRCFDSDSSRDNDTLLALACNGTDYQRWILRSRAGTYEIKNVASGQCLDRNSEDPGYNSRVHLVACNESMWQQWWLEYERRN